MPSHLLILLSTLLAAPALAADFPPLRAGLWESKVGHEDATAKQTVTKLCIDATVQKEMFQAGSGMMKSMCTKNEIRHEGGRIYGASECKLGESTMKSTSVTTFTADTAYRTEVKASYDPPFMGKSGGTTVIEAKWTGPCPSDMQPGDAIVPGGQKINLRTMMGGSK